jgi:hypothetical protein
MEETVLRNLWLYPISPESFVGSIGEHAIAKSERWRATAHLRTGKPAHVCRFITNRGNLRVIKKSEVFLNESKKNNEKFS